MPTGLLITVGSGYVICLVGVIDRKKRWYHTQVEGKGILQVKLLYLLKCKLLVTKLELIRQITSITKAIAIINRERIEIQIVTGGFTYNYKKEENICWLNTKKSVK